MIMTLEILTTSVYLLVKSFNDAFLSSPLFLFNQESEEAVPVRRRIGGPPKGRGAGAAPSDNVNPEECKQQ
jgi:hypothetical protein